MTEDCRIVQYEDGDVKLNEPPELGLLPAAAAEAEEEAVKKKKKEKKKKKKMDVVVVTTRLRRGSLPPQTPHCSARHWSCHSRGCKHGVGVPSSTHLERVKRVVPAPAERPPSTYPQTPPPQQHPSERGHSRSQSRTTVFK
jgi:hypothetical protein